MSKAFASLTHAQRRTRRRILQVLRPSLHRVDTLTKHTMVGKTQTLAVVMAMSIDREVAVYIAVYHSCSRKRVALRALADGFQPCPWTCERCGETVQRDALKYEFLVRKEKSLG